MGQKPIGMSAIAPVAIAAILMLGTLAAISAINHASAQESSNPGNATQGANNPEPLQEMVPAMTITSFQAHITNQQQLANGLTVEKPAASTNEGCYLNKESGGSLVCSPNSGSIVVKRSPVTAEELGKKGFIFAINGITEPGMTADTFHTCYTKGKFSTVTRDGVRYVICETITPPPVATTPQQIPGGAHIPLCPPNNPNCRFSSSGH